MRILLAEDDTVSREMMKAYLSKWGHEPMVAIDGLAASTALCAKGAPNIAVLDWMMPEKDGLQVCREARAARPNEPLYMILLTAKGTKEDIVKGFEAGADDYVIKPFDPNELKARIRAGIRIVELQLALADRIHELEVAMAKIKTLQGLLPICAWCKKVRDDQNYWQRVETYISGHTDARFTHSICPDCKAKQMSQLNLKKPEPSGS
ncbi:MAG: response regulator transcription factor [Planctomycetes bacterium]|nr:response regulator transcription factor [Planctomycetota bacterium]